jgi:hypothetical protein
MDRRNRAEKLHRLNQAVFFVMTVLSFLITLTPSPLEPEVSDVQWRAIGFVLTIMCAFVYLLNHVVGPDNRDEE